MKPSVLLVVSTAFVSPLLPLAANEIEPSEIMRKLLRGMEEKGAAAVKPIVIPPDSRDYTDIEKEQLAWSDRVLIKPALARFEARGNPPWKQAAAKFITQAPSVVFPGRTGSKPFSLAQEGRALVAAGCDDPAVLILAALSDRMCVMDRRYVNDCADKAVAALEADPASKAVLSYHAHHMLTWAYKHAGLPKKRTVAVDKALAAAVRMAEDGSFLPEEAELYLRHLYRDEPPDELVEKMIGLAPKLPLPAWARQTIVGKSEIALAWNSRGNSWGHKVTDDGWKGFGEHLGKARTALTEAWRANPKSPFAAQSMISVVMGGHGQDDDTVQLWFERAIAAQCDFTPAYTSVLWAYRPRWCGGHELMLAFGKACAATKRYDLDVPISFTRACNDIVSEIGDWREFYRRPDIAKTLMDVSEGFVKEPTRKHELTMRLSLLAVNAWLTGDSRRAASALERLAGPLHDEALVKLRSHRVTESQMREEIAIANSPIGADFNRALAAYEAGRLAEAEDLFRRVEPSAQGLGKDSVHDHLQLIGIETKLAGGEWVTLPVDAKLRGWLQRGGNWSGTNDGILVNTGTDTPGGIVHRARVGPDFEMRVTYSVDAQQKCCRRCDILFGWNDGFQEPYNIASFGQSGTAAPVAWIAYNNQPGKEIKYVKVPYQDTNTMLLHSDDGKITFTVNGKVAFDKMTSEDLNLVPEHGRVGVGSYRWCRMNITRISKIEVHRL